MSYDYIHLARPPIGGWLHRKPGGKGSTVAVMCTETKATMVWKAPRDEKRLENAHKHLEKANEACHVGRRIHVKVENKEVFEILTEEQARRLREHGMAGGPDATSGERRQET
jgi:hypothetical protein